MRSCVDSRVPDEGSEEAQVQHEHEHIANVGKGQFSACSLYTFMDRSYEQLSGVGKNWLTLSFSNQGCQVGGLSVLTGIWQWRVSVHQGLYGSVRARIKHRSHNSSLGRVLIILAVV